MTLKNLVLVSLFFLIIVIITAIVNPSFFTKSYFNPTKNEFTVQGEGKVQVVPDTGYVDAGIVASNVPTAIQANKRIAEVNNKIIEAVMRLGLLKQDITTSNYSITPAYSYDRGVEQTEGYNGSATVTIRIKDTTLMPKVIDAVSDAGANQIHSARFEVENLTKFQDQARDMAIADAKNKAEKLATTLGIRLGPVINVVEVPVGGGPIPIMLDKTQTYQGAEARDVVIAEPDIQPGQQTVTSTVTLYYERR